MPSDDNFRSPLPLRDAIEQFAGRKEDLPLKVAMLYMQRLSSLGIPAVPGDVKRFTKAFAAGVGQGSVSLPLSTRRIRKAGLDPKTIAKALSQAPTNAEIEACLERYSEAMSSTITSIMQSTAKEHLRYLKKHGAKTLKEHRAVRQAFLAELQSLWGKALDKFEMLVHIAREVGNVALDAVSQSDVDGIMHFRSDSLRLLYGRGCQIAGEISVLLAAGFPDGAQGRWRSLHEVQVVMRVIADGDEDLAERYLEHYTIDVHGEAELALKHGGTRISPAIEASEYADIKAARDSLLERYGLQFGAPYGWASDRLGYKATRFSDIEKLAEAEYVRPFYKSASGNVHASSGGTLSRLGQPPEYEGLVTGASVYGLARPAMGAAHSLGLSAVTIAQMAESPAAISYAMAMNEFAEQVAAAFERVERLMLEAQRP